MSVLKRVAHEVRAVWVASAWFAACFGVILTLKKLFLAQYQIGFFGLSKALLGGLLVGKVVVVMSGTSFGTRLQRQATVVDVAYRSLTGTFFVAVALSVEKLWHAWRELGEFSAAAVAVVDGVERNRLLATVLCVFLSFAGYHLLGALSRYLGRDRLVRFLFSPAETLPPPAAG